MSNRYKVIDGVRKRVATGGKGRRMRVWRALYGDSSLAPCCYCQKALTFAESTLEHIVPVAQGGPDTIANSNIACWECNMIRSGTGKPGVRKDTLLGAVEHNEFTQITTTQLEDAMTQLKAGLELENLIQGI